MPEAVLGRRVNSPSPTRLSLVALHPALKVSQISLAKKHACLELLLTSNTDDGNIILASDGSYYTFQCCMNESAGSTFLNSVQTTGYDDCIQACANTDKCQA